MTVFPIKLIPQRKVVDVMHHTLFFRKKRSFIPFFREGDEWVHIHGFKSIRSLGKPKIPFSSKGNNDHNITIGIVKIFDWIKTCSITTVWLSISFDENGIALIRYRKEWTKDE